MAGTVESINEAAKPVSEPVERVVSDGLERVGEIDAVRNAATSDIANNVAALLTAPVGVVGNKEAWAEHKKTHTFGDSPIGNALLGGSVNDE